MRTLNGQAVSPTFTGKITAHAALAIGLVIEAPNGLAARHAVEQLKVMLPALSWAHRISPQGVANVACRGEVSEDIARLVVALLGALPDRNEASQGGGKLPWSQASWEKSAPSQRGQKLMFAWGPALFLTTWACPTCGGGSHMVKGQTLARCCASHLGQSQPAILARWEALAGAYDALLNGEGGSYVRLPPALRIRIGT